MNKFINLAKTLEEVNICHANIKERDPVLAESLKNDVLLRKAQIISCEIIQNLSIEEDVVKSLADGLAYYEAQLHNIHNRRQQAGRVRATIKKYGWLKAAERVCTRGNGDGFKTMIAAGHYDYTWERVILENKQFFSDEAINACQNRLAGI